MEEAICYIWGLNSNETTMACLCPLFHGSDYVNSILHIPY